MPKSKLETRLTRQIGSYERTANRLLRGQPKPKPFCQLVNGRFVTGMQSLRRTRQSRTWRLFWRLKGKRV